MRRVLKSNKEVAHYWANQVQSEGRGSSFYFVGPRIYSYGSHFLIARILPNGTFVWGTHSYSPSTGRHQSYARNAIPQGAKIVYCHDPDDPVAANMEYARNAISEHLKAAANPNKRIKENTRVGHRARALELAVDANEYLAAMPDDEKVGEMPIDITNLEGVRAELEAIAAAKRKIEQDRIAKERLAAQERVALWRQHDPDIRSLPYVVGVILRVSKDRLHIETSMGAEIPTRDTRKLWRMVTAARRGERAWQPDEPVGVYRLSEIRADGSMVVGCHDISYEEIEAIARDLGYEVPEEATA